MQPQQPTNPTSPSTPPPDQYDFILNAKQPIKAPLASGSSLPTRILIVVAGLFVLLLVAVFIMKLLGAGGGFDKAAVLSVAQDQTELVRLGGSGMQSGVSQTTKNVAVNVKLTMATQQSQLLTYAASKGLTPKPKLLIAKQSATTDTQLTTATSSSTFDVVYMGIIKQELLQYQQDLTKAYKGADSKGKTLLKGDFDGTQMLVEQITQAGS